jgi:Rrf2 family protein
MLLSKSGGYALRALIHIAEHGEAGPLRTAEIAEALDVPRNYLSKLLHRLAQAGVLESGRGPRGGFTLAHEAASLSLREALAPIEAGALDSGCLLGRPRCSDTDPCPAHDEWKNLRDHIERFLAHTTIADLSTGQHARDAR